MPAFTPEEQEVLDEAVSLIKRFIDAVESIAESIEKLAKE